MEKESSTKIKIPEGAEFLTVEITKGVYPVIIHFGDTLDTQHFWNIKGEYDGYDRECHAGKSQGIIKG